jgi:hypothetical protein
MLSRDITTAKNKLRSPLPVSELTSGRGDSSPVGSMQHKRPSSSSALFRLSVQMLCCGRPDMWSHAGWACIKLRATCDWEARDVRGTYIHPLTGKSSRGGQRRGTKKGDKMGGWNRGRVVATSAGGCGINYHQSASRKPCASPQAKQNVCWGDGLASKTGWGSRWNMTPLSCILFLMLIQGDSILFVCSLLVLGQTLI